jgi:hypothetical protein
LLVADISGDARQLAKTFLIEARLASWLSSSRHSQLVAASRHATDEG